MNIFKYKILITGLLFFIINLVVHFLLMDDYALSWDYHYHHYAGLHHLGLPYPLPSEPSEIPFSLPDSRLTVDDPFGPFTQIVPSLSSYLFHDRLHLFSLQNAYNLPMVVTGALGTGLLFIFIAQAVNFTGGFYAALFLSLLPVHFGYLHNNMKDVPNACAFAMAIYFFWKLVNSQGTKNLVVSVITFAVAFNIKINSVMIPAVTGVWFFLFRFRDIILLIKGKLPAGQYKKLFFPAFFFILSPFAALALWWPFWEKPLAKLAELPYFYSHNTINMPVLLAGRIFTSGVNIPWYYPYLYILITVPPVILFSCIAGIIFSIISIRKGRGIYLLLLIWFFIPLFRYFSPKGGAIDGVRHFMEIVYPLTALSGIFTGWLVDNRIRLYLKNRFTYLLVLLTLFSFLGFNIVKYHPYQTSYFNFLTGGIAGAEGKYDIDFWGTPQKKAMEWLNTHSAEGAYVTVAMAQSTAAVYARNDLRKNMNTKNIRDADYAVILNRQSFFNSLDLYSLINDRTAQNKVLYTEKIDGVPLVWVLGK